VGITSATERVGVFWWDRALVGAAGSGCLFPDSNRFREVSNGFVVLLQVVIGIAAFDVGLHVVGFQPDGGSKISDRFVILLQGIVEVASTPVSVDVVRFESNDFGQRRQRFVVLLHVIVGLIAIHICFGVA